MKKSSIPRKVIRPRDFIAVSKRGMKKISRLLCLIGRLQQRGCLRQIACVQHPCISIGNICKMDGREPLWSIAKMPMRVLEIRVWPMRGRWRNGWAVDWILYQKTRWSIRRGSLVCLCRWGALKRVSEISFRNSMLGGGTMLQRRL